MEENKDEIFREKNLERINSPEELKDYIHVTSPSLWFVIATIVIILIGFIIWGIFGKVEIHNADGSTENVHPITFVIG